MICNFENITMQLTPAERRLIPGVIDIIYRTNSENRIKTPQVVEELRNENAYREWQSEPFLIGGNAYATDAHSIVFFALAINELKNN